MSQFQEPLLVGGHTELYRGGHQGKVFRFKCVESDDCVYLFVGVAITKDDIKNIQLRIPYRAMPKCENRMDFH